MKYITIYLEENKIEIFNSLIGKETIKVNDEVVSSKFSIVGAEHNFQLTDNLGVSECKIITGFGFSGVVIDLYKNGKPIIESPKSGCLGALLIFVIVVFVIEMIDKLYSLLF